MKITKDKDNLIITIPLMQKGLGSPYNDDDDYELDNIIGVIDGNEYGFCGLNDMYYCGKEPQISSWFIKFDEIYDNAIGDKEKKLGWFRDTCKELDIGIHEYSICAYCKKTIYGSHTMGSKGLKCFNCDLIN